MEFSMLKKSQEIIEQQAKEIEDLKTKLTEATRKGFWAGFEDARCFPDEMNILQRWEANKLSGDTDE